MSVFSQLMMRNKMKVEEMPLTVVGSPTINDGVVSGFTASDYLRTANYFVPSSNTWKIEFNINITNLVIDTTYYFCSVGNKSLLLGIRKNSLDRYRFTLYKGSDGTNWDFSQNSSYFDILQTNIYVRIVFDGISYKVDYSENGISWINTLTIADTTVIYQTDVLLTIGRWSGGGSAYPDSIDINKSYLIIDGTKYIFTLP